MEDVWSVLARLRVRPDVQNILFFLRKTEALEKTNFFNPIEALGSPQSPGPHGAKACSEVSMVSLLA